MIKLVELVAKATENVLKAITSTTEQVSVKASVSLIEETNKIDTKALAQQVTHNKEVNKQLDKLFD